MTASVVLGPLLRYVSDTEATIWVEVSGPTTVAVLGRTASTFTVGGHHYALVVVDGLEPATTYPYTVVLDGAVAWPAPDDPRPAPTIRTLGDDHVEIVFGSCRAALPDRPPYDLPSDAHDLARGPDALRAHALRMYELPPARWPDLVLLLGDQVYADDPSPRARRRMHRRRRHGTPHQDPPPDLTKDFEEYAWLYHDSWRASDVRWLLSVVPSAMIFDDHEMIDDWNISMSWVDDIRRAPWWQEHAVAGLVSYWVYQHLGNLPPEAIRVEGLLARCVAAGDATDLLREWALDSERSTPVRGGYTFSYARDLGPVHLVVVDSRNGRVLDTPDRRMVDEDEWAWVVHHARRPCEHLVLATSLPVFVPGGIHGLQQWNEALCAGAWGRTASRVSERLRRAIDLEDWAAFDVSFREFCGLLERVALAPADRAPRTVTVVSGDIHFSYVAELTIDGAATSCRMRQVVASPIRNGLARRERAVIRSSLSGPARRVGQWLGRRTGRPGTRVRWEVAHGPFFDNNMGRLTYASGEAHLALELATRPDGGDIRLVEAVHERLGAAGAPPPPAAVDAVAADAAVPVDGPARPVPSSRPPAGGGVFTNS